MPLSLPRSFVGVLRDHNFIHVPFDLLRVLSQRPLLATPQGSTPEGLLRGTHCTVVSTRAQAPLVWGLLSVRMDAMTQVIVAILAQGSSTPRGVAWPCACAVALLELRRATGVPVLTRSSCCSTTWRSRSWRTRETGANR